MNFVMETGTPAYRHEVVLMDTAQKVIFNPKLRFVFIEIPKFRKRVHELRSGLERWMYLLANLAGMKEKPASFAGELFDNFFKIAEVSRMNFEEQLAYLRKEKAELDYYNTMEYARKEAIKRGFGGGSCKGPVTGFGGGSCGRSC